MVPLNLRSLIGKLDDVCHTTLEAAAAFCLSRSNYNVEIEHWLTKLIEESGTDIEVIFHRFGVDASRLSADLTRVLDRLKTGNVRSPSLSPNVVDLVRGGWLLTSVEYGAPRVRSGFLLAALLNDENLGRAAVDASDELGKINGQTLLDELPTLLAKSTEAGGGSASSASGSAGDASPGGPPSKSPALDKYTIDMTARAADGKIDPVLGRDAEIRQIIDVLTRRRQNNPIMTGEAGVGKTAVVEGFALRLASGDVPEPLRNVKLRSLDLGLLQAGAGVKGEFEKRLEMVIEEVKSSPTPIVLFIDEAHTLVGAGASAGQGDAANLLKPALARGELRTVAATTWAEYKKYFEKDAALARRFQVVKVEEPSEEVGIEMMRGLVGTLEKHHKVRIINEAVVEAVRLSNRYISGRQLPDKAVSLLDTACARVALAQTSTPAALEDGRHRIRKLDATIAILERESAAGADYNEELTDLRQQKAAAETEVAALEKRWKQESELVTKIRAIREQLESGDEAPAATKSDGEPASPSAASTPDAPTPPAGATGKTATSTQAESTQQTANAKAGAATEPLSDKQRIELQQQLKSLDEQLADIQGEQPLVQACVDGQAVADVVSNWTGIPVGRMVSNEIRTVLNLKQEMERRVIGQSHALEGIAESIRTSRAKLEDPHRPIGVFMLAGPSGVGKTETAVVLSELLYGGEQNMTVINMSEFKEEHKVSLLMGSPPGYVGYGEGGVLTEAVRRRPYSIVLLDELEKAHEGVQEIFYQVFDKGTLRDGEGRDIDFKNTVIIATTNAGTELIAKLCADPDTAPEPAALADALHENLLTRFKPAFLGRLNVIPYYPLSDDVMRKIVELKLGKIRRRVKENHHAEFDYEEAVVASIVERCTEVESGARNVDHILSNTMLPEMSAEFLARMADGENIAGVRVRLSDQGSFVYDIH
ncbi:MAG: type VI secretion system ATPase TssH [Pirellulaceae bacterium]